MHAKTRGRMTFCDVPMNASQTWSSQVSLNTPFDDSQQSGQLQQMSQLETPTNIPHFMPADFLLVPSKSLVDTRGPPALNQEGQGSLQNMSLGTSGLSVSQGADGLVGQAASMTDGTGMTQRRFRLNSVSIDALSNNQQQVNNPAVSTSAGVTSSTGSIGHLAVPGNIVLPNVAHSASPLRQLVSESTSLSPTSRVKHRLGAPTPTNPNHRAKTALSIVTFESSQAGRSPGGGAALSADPNMAVPGGHFRARSKSVQYFSTLNRMNPLQTSAAGGTGMGGTSKLVPTTEDMGLTSQDSFTGS